MTDFDRLCADLPTGLWIDGNPWDAIDKQRVPVHNLATGNSITDVADAGANDARTACRRIL
jgi:hypothetical protein